MRPRSARALVLLEISTGLLFGPSPSYAFDEKGVSSIQGKLVVESGKAVLQSNGKSLPLRSDDELIAAAIEDPRVSGRQMKLLGEFRGDGAFEIHKFFVVRGDSLYRLIYFCDT